MKWAQIRLNYPTRLKFVAMFTFAFIVRVLVAISNIDSFWTRGNAGYRAIAMNILSKGQYGAESHWGYLRAFRMPLYPLFLAGGLKIDNTGTMIVVLQVAFNVTAVALACYWAWLVFGSSAAKIGALLALIHPYAISLEWRTIDTPLFTFLVALTVTALMWAINKNESKRFLVVGAIAGLATLTRPSAILLLLFVCIPATILLRRATVKSALVRITFLSVAYLSIMFPWVVRNYIVFNEVIPLSTAGGLNLLKGHNPYYELVHPVYDADILDEWIQSLVPSGSDEVSRDKLWTGRALHYILSNPIYYMKIDIKKIVWYYGPIKVPRSLNGTAMFHNGHVVQFGSFSKVKDTVFALYWGGILFGTIVGAIVIWDKRRTGFRNHLLLLLLFLLVYSTVEAVLAFPDTRFRVPIDPYITMLSGFGYTVVFTSGWGLVQRYLHELKPESPV